MLARQVVLLTSSESFHPTQLLSRQRSTPVCPSTATLMDLLASVANKRLTAELNPFAATPTKNRGAGGVMVNQLPLSSNVPSREGSGCCEGNLPLRSRLPLFPPRLCVRFFPLPVTSHESSVTGSHPPVPNRTAQRPLPYAYNHCAILPSLRPGDRPLPLSWRPS